ncbi:DHHA1 domain-containing protein, partial [Candidatus Bathyarchaeota archaeon]|nr:DHHA1 domain-containing protein [Candidatus Bathyarchaeota archaeon]
NVANALFLGIAFDTRHFVLGNSATFQTISELCEIGVDTKEALSSLSLPMSFSERVARIKACGRARIIIINKWIIAISEVSSYQASAARALIDLGAHLAAIAGKKGENIDMSLRCTNKFNKDTGIHLGKDIAQPLGESLQGMGGGHALAAGLNGKGKVEEGLDECLLLIRKILQKLS